MQSMKLGDLVRPYSFSPDKEDNSFRNTVGVIVGFNKKGEGGRDYVHVLQPDGNIEIFLWTNLEVIDGKVS